MNYFLRYLVFTFLSLYFLISGCSTRVKVPEELLPEDSLASVLADLYYADATLNQTRELIGGNDNDLPKYYKYVLARHGITKKEFDTIFSWYTEHPEILSEVYDKVISILSERETELRNDTAAQKEMPVTSGKKFPRMKDIWKGKRTFTLKSTDTVDLCVPFHIELDSVDSGIFRLIATYRFDKGTLLNKAYMKLWAIYADSSMDSASYSIDKSFTERITTLSLDADRNKKVIGLDGLLLDHDTSVVVIGTIKNIKLLYIPRPPASVH
ncbi:MAG: DUF4296 domain-containing protein [Chlorobi bacterium]|nr:DUF4296 domain-containing protein [Chlorobiota bacterium]